MFSHMACICHFVFLCPAQSLLLVYPVWVHSQCSLEVLLYFFQLFRCRNLALNRVFSYFLVAGMFYTWGVYICMPPYVCTPPYIHTPPRVYMPPYAPILFCASVYFWRFCMLWGIIMGSPLCWDTLPYITPVWGFLPLITCPHLVIGSLCIGMFQGYQYVMWAFPFC